MDFATFILLALFGLACAYVLSRIFFGRKAKGKLPADSYFHPAATEALSQDDIDRFLIEREVERQRAENIRNAPPPIPLDKIERQNPYAGFEQGMGKRDTFSVAKERAWKRPSSAKPPPRPAGSGRVGRPGSHHTTIVDDGSTWTNWPAPDASSSSNCSSSSSSSDTSSSSCSTD